MMQARMQKARRLLDVQRGMQKLEEARIAGLQARKAELAAAQEELVAALNAEEGPQGLLVVAIVRKLQNLNEETARIAEEVERRSAALLEHASRVKFAERRSRSFEQQHARAVADKELLDAIERAIRPDDASLP